uniref:STAS domain-containing protein n=1 Tax=Angiostrongylus cantonensis TaxID=6313 RepID=A0A0K0DAJ8_ANGCA
MKATISVSTSSALNTRNLIQAYFDEFFKCCDPELENKFVVMTTKLSSRFYRPCRSCNDFWVTLLSFFPVLHWLPKYNIYQNLLPDAVGGFMVGIMHVPQGIAYAILAGVHPAVGLYTSFFPVLAYMLFGTSRHASIGSFAIVALMTGETVYRLTDAGEAIEVATALTLTIGLIQIIVAILGLDFVTTYFSEQLVAGFTTGAAVHVFVTQLKGITGIYGTPRRFGFANAILVSFCSKSVLTQLLKYLPILIPFELLVVILGAIFSTLLNLNVDYEVAVVGHIPTGVPLPSLPRLTLVPQLLKDAISIFVVIMAVHISMAKLLAKTYKYTIDTKQEFFAAGFTSVIASFFPVFPSSCSLARTLVNASAGTKTQALTFSQHSLPINLFLLRWPFQLFAVFSSLFVFFVIQFGGSWLRTLPMCILASIIVVAVFDMFSKFGQLPKLWKISKIDWAIWVVAFLATSCIDVMDGLTIAIIFALLTTVFRQQWPSWQILGRLKGTTEYRDIKRYQEVHFIKDVCIVRFDAPLLFTNVERFREMIDIVTSDLLRVDYDSPSSNESSSYLIAISLPERDETLKHHSSEKCLVIDCSAIVYIDMMGVNCMKEVYSNLREKSIHVFFASTRVLLSFELHSTVSKDNFFPTINDAVFFANHRR